ncbi:intraflagellar transport protein 22 homolog isoform X2 [Lycorma delicatula]|uniref:intraflagellar transport protein 22 homolog isoform X2 n=1 Tax=Lycorma delicatula TaxID=130591 RepID=UPI003F50FD32
MIKLKTVIIGPSNSGKSTIANYLSDATDISGGDYRPTKGVRIVEFETQNLNVNNRNAAAEIELWDCSGNKMYENCWPACYRDAQGIIFVYDADSDEQLTELDEYFDNFVVQSGIDHNNCLIIAHSLQNSNSNPTAILSSKFSRMTHITANAEESGNKLRSNFNNFISNIISGVHDRNERDELNIINVPLKI